MSKDHETVRAERGSTNIDVNNFAMSGTLEITCLRMIKMKRVGQQAASLQEEIHQNRPERQMGYNLGHGIVMINPISNLLIG
jgi:hypothetical protein